jgi:NAD-dependent DNA ligase
MKIQLSPLDDGKTHLNIYSKGKTWLGRELSNLSRNALSHPSFGTFSSLEGYWYWLGTGKKHDVLRDLTGVLAKKEGKALERVFNPFFQKEFKQGMICRLLKNHQLFEALRENTLPLAHYYYYGDESNCKVIDVSETHQWQLDYYQQIVSMPPSDLMGQAVQLVGPFECNEHILSETITERLGGFIGLSPNHTEVVVLGNHVSRQDENYYRDNCRCISEQKISDHVGGDNYLWDIYEEVLQTTTTIHGKLVVLKGEFETPIEDVHAALIAQGYTVLTRPNSTDDVVVMGNKSDDELYDALNSVNVLVITEQRVLKGNL